MILRQFYKSIYLYNMSIVNSAFIEPLPLDDYIFGSDFILEWNGPHFVISEADNLVKVGDVTLNPSVVYPLGGNVVGKTYITAALPDELLPNWRPFSVCGHPYYPAFFFIGSRHFFHYPISTHCACWIFYSSE
jgi:hypothetical protein